MAKNKEETINPKNNDDKCFQYVLTDALNCQNFKRDPQRISKIKSFTDFHNWKVVNFQSHKKLGIVWIK